MDMFDVDHEDPGCVSPEPNNEPPARQQYTLKGVEADTIRLMRDAAGKEGMKIGSWVSLRMKEAAEKALNVRALNSQKNEPLAAPEYTSEVAHQICILINAQREEADARFLKVERELHEIAVVQRTILTRLLAAN
jgi:hypothetical protein